MRIAIIGTGISGLTAAYLLNRQHDISVFEADHRMGGHTATMDVEVRGEHYAIDTGFIVFNDWTYPNFIRLLEQLGVQSQPTHMGFSASCPNTGIEYAGNNLNSLFAQRRNLLRPSHWQMLKDIVRFNREAVRDWREGRCNDGITLGEYLQKNRYSQAFIDRYLIPMGSAIWSATLQGTLNFPLQFFVRFFYHHGLLNISKRPTWRVIKGGSRKYLAPLTQSFRKKIYLNTAIASIERYDAGVTLKTAAGEVHNFDQVVIATHSNQALSLLSNATAAEVKVLSALPYRNNDVVLHTDTKLLPSNRRTWSSWNYHLQTNSQQPPILTYNMNILQGLQCAHTFCVTLNHSDAIAEDKILSRYQYAHPVFTLDGIAAQERWQEINGVQRTWFCGAYWFNGFHEDGVRSALRVAEQFGESL